MINNCSVSSHQQTVPAENDSRLLGVHNAAARRVRSMEFCTAQGPERGGSAEAAPIRGLKALGWKLLPLYKGN